MIARARHFWVRLQLWWSLWWLTSDPCLAGVVLALRHYRRETNAEQEHARRAEAVAWTLAWARDHEVRASADRVRSLVDLLTGFEPWPLDSTS